MRLAIVPAYNEARSVGSVVRGLLSQVDRVVVVDDGSADATAKMAHDAGALVVSHVINRGQGASLETGHEYARRVGADIIVDFDADGQFQVADIPRAIRLLESTGADVVLGSRFLGQKQSIPWLKKFFVLPIGRWVNRLYGAPALSDAHNGFRIYTKQALALIFIGQDRMAHATEIPAQAKKNGLHIVECPVTVQYHRFGQRPAHGFRILWDLFLATFV